MTIYSLLGTAFLWNFRTSY